MKDVAELYGCEKSLNGIEEFRRVNGLESITSTCFKAAKISAIFIDDGVKLDKEHDIEWHKAFAPFVGRILRIEHLAETILDEVRCFELLSCFYSWHWYLNYFLDLKCISFSGLFRNCLVDLRGHWIGSLRHLLES